jgi:hypothetical protein
MSGTVESAFRKDEEVKFEQQLCDMQRHQRSSSPGSETSWKSTPQLGGAVLAVLANPFVDEEVVLPGPGAGHEESWPILGQIPALKVKRCKKLLNAGMVVGRKPYELPVSVVVVACQNQGLDRRHMQVAQLRGIDGDT